MPKALINKAVVKPLIKKSNLDPDVLGNYRPVSIFKPSVLVQKPRERAVSDANNLQVQFKSAYRCGHSTKTIVLRVLNDLLSMIGAGNNALVLLVLSQSAAFTTTDHSLLLKRLHDEIILQDTVLEGFSS